MTHFPSNPATYCGPSERHFSRTGTLTSVLGLLVYTVAAVLHPGTAPHETEAAFAHYAEEPAWGLIHLAELFGVLLMCVTVLALAWRLRRGAAGVWALLGATATIVFASAYAVFTAVDGVALGVMVRRLAEATPEQRELLFESAYAVRQVEAGLFGVQWALFGVATGLFTPAFACSPDLPRPWSGTMTVLSGVASVGMLAFGAVQIQHGFSELSMIFQAGLYLGVLWVIVVGIFLFKNPEAVGTS